MAQQPTPDQAEAPIGGVFFQVKIDKALSDRLDAVAAKHGLNRSAFTRLALLERIERYESLAG